MGMKWLVLIAAMGVAWSADDDYRPLLEQARAKVAAEIGRIPRYVCRQKIERQISTVEPRAGSGCSQLLDLHAKESQRFRFASFDRARLDVMLQDAEELFSWPGEHKFETSDPSSLLPAGISGSGDFAGFLTDVFDGSRASVKYQGTCGGAGCIRFEYDVARAKSRYVLKTSAGSYVSGYRGIFDIDSRNANLLQLTVRPTYLRDPGICVTETTVRYGRAKTSAGEFLIPESTERTALYLNGEFFDNKTSYEGCKQYTTESVLKFDDSDASAPSPQAKAAEPAAAPPKGAILKLRLMSAIDSETSAAGDAVEAALAQPVRDDSGRVVTPAGTIVRGHLTELERSYVPSILVKIHFSAIVLGGSEAPLKLKPEPQKNLGPDDTFIFRGKRASLGKNFVSTWIVEAP
jgi:hypothetical protein